MKFAVVELTLIDRNFSFLIKITNYTPTDNERSQNSLSN